MTSDTEITVTSENGEEAGDSFRFHPTMVAHFVCVLFSGFIIYTARPGSSLFSWHPTLMAVAFMLLVAEAILVFSPQSSLFLRASRQQKVKAHWLIMVSALIFASAGVFSIWYNKKINSKPHLASWHGILGYTTLAYLLTQCMAGTLQLYPKTAMKFVKLAGLKMMHATSGLVLFVLASSCLILGMFSNWFVGQVTGTSWYACVACPVILMTMATNQVTAAYLKPRKK